MPSPDFSTINLREKFLEFFEKKGHKILPSSSLLPENDPSVLFTTAGMQQFKRFYDRPDEAPAASIATCQKCIRTGDIEEVGDETHLTFFEMLGNFSFGYPEKDGSYFKKEAIEMSWEFLTAELGVEKDRISCTYFAGDKGISEDHESHEILKKVTGLEDSKILGTGFDETFWSLGTQGSPGGPTVEFYIDGVEIWNLVFNEYKFENGEYVASELKGVDTGMGLDRLVAVLNKVENVYHTDLFEKPHKKLHELLKIEGSVAERIVLDHIKAAAFITNEGIEPSNKGQGYILRRLIRRAVRYSWLLGIKSSLTPVVEATVATYPNESFDREDVIALIQNEEERFFNTIESGSKKADEIIEKKKPISEDKYDQLMQLDAKREILSAFLKNPDESYPELDAIGLKKGDILAATLSGKEIFDLYQSFGFPKEMILEIAQKEHLIVDNHNFREELKVHQEKSRTAPTGMFKGGLESGSEQAAKYHTATHLLLAALRQVLGDHVFQKGSNITSERLRFDFSHPDKLTDEQIQKVEDIVNEKIKETIPVKMEKMPVFEAKKSGAIGVFDEKYAENVKVYSIGPNSSTSSEPPFSREICGGPHTNNTSELGRFKIIKEESSSSGVRRIKAVLE